MDLVRRIILDVADSNGDLNARHWEEEGSKNSHDKVGYHIWLLNDAGYLRASFMNADDDPYYNVIVSRLTWEGQDLADSLRSQKVWDEVKKRLSDLGVDVAVSVVKTLAIKVACEQLGISA